MKRTTKTKNKSRILTAVAAAAAAAACATKPEKYAKKKMRDERRKEKTQNECIFLLRPPFGAMCPLWRGRVFGSLKSNLNRPIQHVCAQCAQCICYAHSKFEVIATCRAFLRPRLLHFMRGMLIFCLPFAVIRFNKIVQTCKQRLSHNVRLNSE